jgi:dienelactone hydrolase
VVPIIKGTYERGDNEGVPDTALDTNQWRDLVVADAKDLSRTIDYLSTRTDLALDSIGYLGHSRGGAFGPVFLALEPRIKAAVFWVPGFHRSRAMPEIHPISFAPRMKQPVLVLNGRYDAIFPEKSSQLPFFRSLGTPDQLKQRIVYESGHNLPVNDRIKETIAWFDRHLRPVR